MEAVAEFSYEAKTGDELSFVEGSEMKILCGRVGENSYRAEMHGKVGLVRANYVQLKPAQWFEEKCTRQEAEEKLMPERDGCFIVRESESTPGDFALSVKNGDGVHHQKILRDGAGQYFLWSVKFKSVNQLVDYHRSSTVIQNVYALYLRNRGSNKFARAMCDYTARSEDEISFKAGDDLKVEHVNGDSCRGYVLGTRKVGMFPRMYIGDIIEINM